MTRPLPRNVIAKQLASGLTGFYFNVPTHFRKLRCTIPNEPLGTDYVVACGGDSDGGRAAALNALFDEWRAKRDGEPVAGLVRFGTVDWLFREYKSSQAYLERVSLRSRPDYERVMHLLTDMVTKKGDRIGSRPARSITPVSADKIYNLVIRGPRGERLRQGEKLVVLCRRAWRVVHRLYPDQFNRDVPNPWQGVTKRRRVQKTKPAVTREDVYKFAWAAIEAGHPEPAAAAVVSFEWLQRPENVLAGCIAWPDYRGRQSPNAIKIEHHKTGAVVWHPLEETTDARTVKFYADAEAVLACLPRRGVPLILKIRRDGGADPFRPNHMARAGAQARRSLRSPGDVHTGCLSARRHDRARRSRVDYRAGQGAFRSSNRPRLCRIRQADNGAGPCRNPQAPCALAGERRGNKISE